MADPVEEHLEHYGIKGMKWGKRKAKDTGPGSSDAEKAKQHAQVAKTKGTKALTNKELQELVTRMNLEQQYSTLQAKTKKENPAAKFAKELVVQVGKEQAGKFVRDQAAKQIAKTLAGR